MTNKYQFNILLPTPLPFINRPSPDSNFFYYYIFISRRRSNRSSEQARRMFEKCIQISGSFVPAYLGLSKTQSGIMSGISLQKALKFNDNSPIVRLEFADWLLANSWVINALIIEHLNQHPFLLDLYIEALRHYTLGIRYKGSLKASFIVGALKTLRSSGHKERMYQYMLR